MRTLCFVACSALFCAAAFAQYPAPSDPPRSGPPSGYPPGGYPPGTTPQAPTTGREQTWSKHGKDKKKKHQEDLPTISAEGRTLSNDGKKLVVKVDDGRTLTMAIAPETKWLRAGASMEPTKIVRNSMVKVTAAEEDNFDLTATQVEWEKDAAPVTTAENTAGPSAAPAKPNTSESAKDDDAELTGNQILHAPDAPDHPTMRRNAGRKSGLASVHGNNAGNDETSDGTAKVEGKTVNVAAKKDGDLDFSIDSDSPAPPKHSFGTELLDRTMDWTGSFMQGLPNYTVEQNTTRYSQQGRGDDWHPQDVISAKVIYEDGHETYKDIQQDGKKTNKTMMELGGQTSTGEFGGMLASLFQPVRNTEFKFERSSTLGDTEVVIYSFHVALANSDWQIVLGGQTLLPAYDGKIWVSKKTAEILRFEQDAKNIPKDFPMSSVETAVDYEPVSLGTTKYLLPVHSENIGCHKGIEQCNKNVIEFRDYHKYAGESTIIFK